ncbi:MAG: hypothetical protein MSH12_03520 [Romboutsia timonensis]|nr:hypothetical protein [Romboutsia timonensis]MCI6667206.1 hypothetical protein [Romboutsia timonensis]
MKKILSIVISGILAVGIVGCSNTVEKEQVQKVFKLDFIPNMVQLFY